MRVTVPGQVFLFDYTLDVKDGISDEDFLREVMLKIANTTFMEINDPMMIVEKQALICPACQESFEDLVSSQCPHCHQQIIDEKGQPLLVGGRQITVGKGIGAVSWSMSFETSEVIFIPLQNATLTVVKNESKLMNIIKKGRIEAAAERERMLHVASGIMVASDMGSVDKAAKMAKASEASLRGKPGFTPKLV